MSFQTCETLFFFFVISVEHLTLGTTVEFIDLRFCTKNVHLFTFLKIYIFILHKKRKSYRFGNNISVNNDINEL